MKVVVATDKFAGTMTAPEACRAIAEGWAQQRPHDDILCVPMADGGPGTVDVIAASTGGRLMRTATIDQRGRPIEAAWLDLDGATAVIEACAACGLDLVPEEERTPMTIDTRGVGRLIRVVADAGFQRIVVGLGGTGTVDGGVGAALGLGADVRSSHDVVAGPVDYDAITAVGPVEGLPGVVAATDVTNPLLGAEGAARVFGPQKGADPATVEILEQQLTHVATVVEACLPGGPWRDRPGAGAAGGLGFGLMAWAGAEIVAGSALVAEMVALDGHLAGADLVITGEGSLDSQTLAGKAPARVAEMAARRGVPAAAVAGRIESEASRAFADVEALGPRGLVEPVAAARRAGARLAERIGVTDDERDPTGGAGPGSR